MITTSTKKRIGHSCVCREGHEHIGVGAGIVLLNERNEVFLAHRTSKTRNRSGVWMKPGGTLEKGESVEEMLKREMKEEWNVDICVENFLCFDEDFADGEQHWMALSFLGSITGGTMMNMEPDKHDKYGWFSFRDLPKPISLLTPEMIQKTKEIRKIVATTTHT